MAITDSQYARIEAYLLDEMTTQERQVFEEDCRQQPELQAALDQERNLHKVVRIHAQMELRQKLKALQAQEQGTKTIPLRPTWYQQNRILISIAAILIVAIGAFFWPTNALSLSDMAPTFAERSGSDKLVSDLVSDFAEWFKQEDYNTILKKFPTLSADQKENDTLEYFAGMAHLGLENYDAAITQFDSIITPTNHRSGIPCHAKWALAYAYQKQGNPRKALQALNLNLDLDGNLLDPDGNPLDLQNPQDLEILQGEFRDLDADQINKLKKMIKDLLKAVQ